MITVYTDGGARGNPGPAGIGVVIQRSVPGKDPGGSTAGGNRGSSGGSAETLEEFGAYIGEATNNQAEYSALLAGLDRARKHTDTELTCVLDSELVVKQLNGEYKVKSEQLKKLVHQVRSLEQHFKSVTYMHTLREGNKRADALVNRALDAQSA